MSGTARQWYYRLERNRGVPTSPQFIEPVNALFGPPVRSNPFNKLMHLRRTGTVKEYQEQFLALLSRCDGVTEMRCLSCGVLEEVSWGSSYEYCQTTTHQAWPCTAMKCCVFEAQSRHKGSVGAMDWQKLHICYLGDVGELYAAIPEVPT